MNLTRQELNIIGNSMITVVTLANVADLLSFAYDACQDPRIEKLSNEAAEMMDIIRAELDEQVEGDK